MGHDDRVPALAGLPDDRPDEVAKSFAAGSRVLERGRIAREPGGPGRSRVGQSPEQPGGQRLAPLRVDDGRRVDPRLLRRARDDLRVEELEAEGFGDDRPDELAARAVGG